MIYQAIAKNIHLLFAGLLMLFIFYENAANGDEAATITAVSPAVQAGELREILQKNVHDNTPLETLRERVAWDAVFTKLSETPLESLQEESIGKVEFRELRTQSDAYRGRIVTIRGKLLRAQFVPLGIARMVETPTPPINGYYECWILLPDEPLFPLCACVISLEEGIHPGERLEQEVVLNGYFYKRRTYPGEDDKQYVTPVILGKTLEIPRTAAGTPTPEPFKFSRSLSTTILIIGLVVIWLVIRSGIRKKERNKVFDKNYLNKKEE